METSIVGPLSGQELQWHLREDQAHRVVDYHFHRYLPEDLDIENALHKAFEECNIPIEQERKLHALISDLSYIHFPTLEHSYRVGYQSYRLAKLEGLDPAPALCAGLVHDCGKIRVDQVLLEKVVEWTADDSIKIQEHAMHSYRILVESGLPFLADIDVRHHRFQKNPYPQILPALSLGSDAKLVGRYAWIVALADHFDSMHRINSRRSASSETVGFQIRDEMLCEHCEAEEQKFLMKAFDSGVFPILARPTKTTYRCVGH